MSGAQEFFDQLTIFSDRYAKYVGVSNSISPWGYSTYRGGGKPVGAVLHYTADEDFHRVVRWFLRERYESRSSSHVVVADCLMPKHAKCAEGLPLIQELPVTVVQTRKPNTAAWHATWLNHTTYGIENVCAGEIRPLDQGGFATWRPRDASAGDWTLPWDPAVAKDPIQMYGRWWSPYPSAQIETNVLILRYLRDLFGSLRPSWIVGHEVVQGIHTNPRRPTDKRDPGPTFPIHGIRESVFDNWVPLFRAEWFQNFEADPMDGKTWRDGALVDWVRWKVDDPGLNPTPRVASARFQSHLKTWLVDSVFGVTGKTALYLLGFHLSDVLDGELDSDEIVSVRIFQELVGVHVDGYPGKYTKEALVGRLADRGFFI